MQESQLRSMWLTFLLCSAILTPFTAAQTNSTTNYSQEDDSLDSATMAILVLLVVSAILFLGSFSLWIQSCCVDSGNSYTRSAMSLGSRSRYRQRAEDQNSLSAGSGVGVDKAVIDSFPTILYSAAKGMKIGVGSVECAVCLSEFAGDETLRMLPNCNHVFHLQCIAKWLANHSTCPICRARVIDSCRNPIEVERNIPIATAIDPVESAGDRNSASASQSSGDCGRYALKLPDGVKEEIVKAKLKLKRSASCEILTGVSGGGEGSGSQLGRWLGRSERWGSIVVPSDCMAVKGDGAGDRFAMLPV